jgi:inward rectifier potassium channel
MSGKDSKPSERPVRGQRFLDNKGRPTLEAVGLPRAPLRDLYHRLVIARWSAFIVGWLVLYSVLHFVFAGLYAAAPGSVSSVDGFWDAYFFSVQTMLTIGYGTMSPLTTYAHVLVTIEAYLGLFLTAVLTGLIFAKFATPTANVMFASSVCVAKHEGKTTLSMRLANARGNRLISASLEVAVAKTVKTLEGETFRKVVDLQLVRNTNPLFWVGWTAMHVIDETSPFFGETTATLTQKGMEMIVILSGVDEHTSQSVHARRSYGAEEIKWGARFVDIIAAAQNAGGLRRVDYRRFHDTQPAEL